MGMSARTAPFVFFVITSLGALRAEAQSTHPPPDSDALDTLIAEKNHSVEKNAAPSPQSTEVENAVSRNDGEFLVLNVDIPPAPRNMKLSPSACLAMLEKLDVAFVRPGFDTPLIETPVLLSAPVAGVRVGPHYSGNKRRTNAVMDCHLALAMVAVADIAKQLGIEAIEFYSTYRPLKAPPKRCPKGKRRGKCLKKRRKYAKTVKAQKSQHRFGRAIDIRWFKTNDGRTIDVLTHFDRRSGIPPCSYRPNTQEGKILNALVCNIHHHRLFTVMLTPNANKDHHNHFHFDLTPKVRFNILR